MLVALFINAVFAASFIEKYVVFLVDHHQITTARRFLWLQEQNPEAIHWIGMLGIEGFWSGKKEANGYFEKAARRGYAPSMVALADSYYSGDGIEKNVFKAFFWYQKAAAKNFAPAYFHLGVLYRDGIGVKKSTVKARHYFKKAFIYLPHLRDSIRKLLLQINS
jgi:TPR repeat protein